MHLSKPLYMKQHKVLSHMGFQSITLGAVDHSEVTAQSSTPLCIFLKQILVHHSLMVTNYLAQHFFNSLTFTWGW